MNEPTPAAKDKSVNNTEKQPDAKARSVRNPGNTLSTDPDINKPGFIRKIWKEFFIAAFIYVPLTFLIFILFDWTSLPVDSGSGQHASEAIRLKEYELHISLFQFYLTLGFSAFTFFCVMTGSILAYILKNYEESPEINLFKSNKWKIPILTLPLLLPILISSVFGCTFYDGAQRWYVVRKSIGTLRDGLHIQQVPDLQILLQMLYLFAWILWGVGFILLIFFLLGKDKLSKEITPG